jgi:ferritin
MLSKKMNDALNAQINAENFSASMYYSMVAYFESLTLKGFAHWMRVQTLEELTHVQKFFNFINERSGRVILTALDAPPTEWESPLAAFQNAYEHEVKISGMINKLMDLAIKESDHATANFLQWFVGEQVEEEASADEVVQRLKLVEKTEGGIFLLDQEMDKRTFTLPPDLVGVF